MRTAPECTSGPGAGPLAVSVVVASRDRPAMLAETLACLEADTCEVIVVDSASADAAAVKAVAAEAGASCLRCDLPGASRARNVGARAATGDLLAFTDDDCRPGPGWVEAVAGAFDALDVGFLAGRVVPDDTGGGPVSTIEHEAARRFDGPADPIDIGHGANMAVRAVAFAGVGGFDERLGAGAPFRGAEDHDLFYRVLLAGWSGRYVPSATVVHHQWRSRPQAIGVQLNYGLGAGAFAAKHWKLRRADGRRLVTRRLWDDGVRQATRDLRAGYRTGVVVSLVRTAGVAAGLAAGLAAPVRDGRYVR